MKITQVCINGVENPIGFHYDYIICSWKVEETSGTRQANARIEVSLCQDFSQLLYVKESETLNQSGEQLLIDLKPYTTYYYRVSVSAENGENAASEICCFETGKRNEPWIAKWISAPKEDRYHPRIRKKIHIKKDVLRARLYAAGVGLFEAYFDGKKLGDEYLMPYLTNYERNIQVMTFPVEGVRKGFHTLEFLLGKGWYMGVFGLEDKAENYGNRMAVIGELRIEYSDGTADVIGTDESFWCQESEVRDSGIYLGEIIDYCNISENKEWKHTEIIEKPEKVSGCENLALEHLMDRISVPVTAHEKIPVKEIIHTPAGETILDMGQNFAGFVEFKALLPKGTEIVLDFGEILQQGNFYNKNYRHAQSQFIYVSDGKERIVRAHFTFFGFRYVRVSGWQGELKKEDFTGRALYSDLRQTGCLQTSNEKINRLYQNTIWGQKSNFIDMPTDCPQRSERLGWTGDAQVFSVTAGYHMDVRAFFHKFIKDLRDEQMFIGGAVPNYLPNFGHKKDAGSVWGDVATFIPYNLYHYYGNVKEAEYDYPLMKDWVNYIDEMDAARGKKHYLFDFGFHFGDWLALDGPSVTSYKGSTDDTYIASMYYCRSVQMVSEFAQMLGKSEDAEYYQQLSVKIRDAVLKEFFTPNGRLSVDTQAAYVIALKFGIYVDRNRLIEQFVRRLNMDGNQIKCGFVGAPLLCTVLAEAGKYELAYDFLLNEKFPGWLYEVNLGATTVWERWNSVLSDGTISDTDMNSLNHYAYGSVMEFVYAYVAGIRPKEPGFGKALIAPNPDIRLPKVMCSYDSVNGRYACCFELKTDGTVFLSVEVPFNCEAELIFPGTGEHKILSAGKYEFSYLPKQNYRKPYGWNSSLIRLARDERSRKILEEYVPALAEMGTSEDPEWCFHTLEEMSHMAFVAFDPQKLSIAVDKLREIEI